MSYLRSLSATALSALCSFSLVTASGCGTSAVGVDDCRDIEKARCRASEQCGTVDDVAACERYVRDHCLHGLAGEAPGAAAVAECVSVIEAAGRCAEGNPDVALDDCEANVTQRRSGLRKACDVVAHPERATECAFLADLPDDDGSGGAGGQPNDDGSGTGSSAGAGAGGESAPGGAPAE